MTQVGKFTEREIGAALQELQEVRHDYRNLKTIVILLSENQDKMRVDQARFHTKLTTIASIGIGLFAVIGWILSFLKAG